MQAGLLREIITIEKAVDTVNPVNGEQLRSWSQV